MCRNIRTLYNYEPPRNREAGIAKARARNAKRFAGA